MMGALAALRRCPAGERYAAGILPVLQLPPVRFLEDRLVRFDRFERRAGDEMGRRVARFETGFDQHWVPPVATALGAICCRALNRFFDPNAGPPGHPTRVKLCEIVRFYTRSRMELSHWRKMIFLRFYRLLAGPVAATCREHPGRH